MRQTAPRRPPERVAVTTRSTLSASAGDQLDLGMSLTVYCAAAALVAPATGAEDEDPGAAASGADPCFTEH